MTSCDAARAVLADVLDYPGPDLCRRVEETVAQLVPLHPAAASDLDEFLRAVKGMPLGELRELYTGTFDFQPSCSLHAGWHLFGGDQRRGLFLAGLAERYRARGFSPGRELPDHVPVMLRYASEPDGESEELVAEALVPAMRSIQRELERLGNPYRHAVGAALGLLRPEAAAAPSCGRAAT